MRIFVLWTSSSIFFFFLFICLCEIYQWQQKKFHLCSAAKCKATSLGLEKSHCPFYKINADSETHYKLLHGCSGWMDGQTDCTSLWSMCASAQLHSACLSRRYICHQRHLSNSKAHRFIIIPARLGSASPPCAWELPSATKNKLRIKRTPQCPALLLALGTEPSPSLCL